MKTLILAIAAVIITTSSALAAGSLALVATGQDNYDSADTLKTSVVLKQSAKVSDALVVSFTQSNKLSKTIGGNEIVKNATLLNFNFKAASFSLSGGLNVNSNATNFALKHNDSGIKVNLSFSDSSAKVRVAKTFKW